MEIRTIRQADLSACLAIYNRYITDTTVTFEETPLTEADWRARVARITERYPYLVACEGDRILGYAYLDAYSERSAYRFTADLSVYLDQAATGKGIGGALLAELERRAAEMGIVNLISIVTGENRVSMAFHEKHGFVQVGRPEKVGFKQGRWLDVVFYQKRLAK
ncbi:MAG TPA: GNAT family N-acetyltransferase [Clostridiales bacterium]|nr:GNAT family N-acetyltransferase [Clostridiales bacterium]